MWICVIHIPRRNKNVHFHRMVYSPSNVDKIVATHCSAIFGNQFISLSSLVSACWLKLSFEQKWIHLFWVNSNFFLIFWVIIFWYPRNCHSQIVVKWNSYTAIYVVLNLETHFLCLTIVTLYWSSSLELASKQQPKYSIIRYCFFLFLLYVTLSSSKFL